MSRKIIWGLIVGAAMSLPVVAQANDLTTVNNSNHDSTCVVNNGPCSTILGEKYGVTKAHSTNTIPSSKVWLACVRDTKNCKANVYMTNNCSGPVVGTVTLNTDTGVTNVYNTPGSGYVISSQPGTFTVTINGN